MSNIAANHLTLTEALRAIDQGRLTSHDVIAACIERIEARDGEVRAWEHVANEAALENARKNGDRLRETVLKGLPIGIKDIIDTCDMPTTYGSPIYRENRVAWDAASVALLRSAGATILGKTTSTEFATREPCRTRNPVDLGHSPGGSSSGSAAAVADCMVPAALGSQTTGSTIRPASYCGIYALKPSFGLINRAGLRPLSDSFDTVTIFARCVEDLHLLLGCASGGSSSSPWPGPAVSAPRIGFCRTRHWDLVEGSAQLAIEERLSDLSAAGARVAAFDLPNEFDGLDESQARVANHEIWRALSHERLSHWPVLSRTLKARFSEGSRISSKEYRDAVIQLDRCRAIVDDRLAEYDCILAPSASGEAPVGLQSTGNPIFQQGWHALHLPAVNIPAITGPGGLPVGLQLIGRRWADDALLSVAEWVRGRLGVACGTQEPVPFEPRRGIGSA